MAFDIVAARTAIHAVAARMEAEQDALNALDGQLGDGDLGITLVKAFRALDGIRADLPADLGQACRQCAASVARVSSSSFGTLLATALMSAGKALAGRTEIPAGEIPVLLSAARDAMAARGKAAPGDKTVLDAMAAAAGVTADDPRGMGPAMRAAVAATLDEFRGKPNRIGRARIFADRSVGLDDPGMVAFAAMLAALDGT